MQGSWLQHFFVATDLWAVDESIEVPFFRRLEKHVFALQTIFGMLHVRCGDVCIKTGFIPPFHVQEEKRWIFRALGPMIAESATPLRFCNACLQLSCWPRQLEELRTVPISCKGRCSRFAVRSVTVTTTQTQTAPPTGGTASSENLTDFKLNRRVTPLLIIRNRLRCSFAECELRAHFL